MKFLSTGVLVLASGAHGFLAGAGVLSHSNKAGLSASHVSYVSTWRLNRIADAVGALRMTTVRVKSHEKI